MDNNLKPVLKVFYDPIKRDWNQKIEAELRRRGLTEKDLNQFCVMAIPERRKRFLETQRLEVTDG